jgi:hypothetical protein
MEHVSREDAMDDTPFYLTRAGKQFYERTVPELVRQLQRLNENLERVAERLGTHSSERED